MRVEARFNLSVRNHAFAIRSAGSLPTWSKIISHGSDLGLIDLNACTA